MWVVKTIKGWQLKQQIAALEQQAQEENTDITQLLLQSIDDNNNTLMHLIVQNDMVPAAQTYISKIGIGLIDQYKNKNLQSPRDLAASPKMRRLFQKQSDRSALNHAFEEFPLKFLF
jgi:hypothetical protein